MIVKTFGPTIAVTVAGLVLAFVLGGPSAFVLVAILTVLEISLSFDNAVVNATILVRMSEFWQKMFLTVGIVIAVFGMRLVFPLLIVGVTASLGPVEAVRLALAGGSEKEAGTYAYLLNQAHPAIAAFGGMFLGMLFLDFVLSDREIRWFSRLERWLSIAGRVPQLAVVVAGGALVLVAETLAGNHASTVLAAGILGIVIYLLVKGMGELFEAEGENEGITGEGSGVETSHEDGHVAVSGPRKGITLAAGRAGFFLFLYLELIDASFSFDGVIGAFAITQSILVIAAGLGIGAMYIRSLTVFLVRKGSLNDYVYLEHGAHWAIGALAVILLVSIRYEVPELVTGLIGLVFIAAALLSSLVRNRRNHRALLSPSALP